MPLLGTLDVKARRAEAPLVTRLASEPWTLPRASILHLLFEIDDATMLELLPPALHPTIPPTVQLVVMQAPESSAGPFTLALCRVGCRASAFQRGFVTRAYCDSEAAIQELRERYGFDVRRASVRLARYHDRVIGQVEHGGRSILDCELVDPIAIGTGDVRYVDNLTLARLSRGGAEVVRLLQIDPVHEIRTADRGKPALRSFDADAWGAPGLRTNYAVSGSIVVADVTLPKLRFAIDPEKPAYLGTEQL